MKCSINDCLNDSICRSWCPMHYARWRSNGDPNMIKTTRIDLTDQRFGFLTVKELHSSGGRFVLWKALCDCGQETIVKTQHLVRKEGSTKSCGCRNGLNNDNYGVAKVKWIYDRNTRERGIEQNLTVDQISFLISQNCFYCGSLPSNEIKKKKGHRDMSFFYNGIDRVDNNLGYEIENCVPCCQNCNMMKRNLSQEEFLSHVKKICLYLKSPDFT